MELSDPTLSQTALDAELQWKGAQADLANLQVQVNSDLMNQKATEAGVRSDYEQAKIQHDVDVKLVKEGLTAQLIENLSRVKVEQLAIRAQLEGDKTRIAADSGHARIAAQQAKVDETEALYHLKKSQVDALHVRAGIDGVLQLVPVEVGQHITPGTNLARVADPKKLKAEVKIAETQAKDVLIGQKASIDTRNGIVGGHVSRIDPSVVNGTVTVDVTIDEPLPNGARPDLSVDGTITLENLKDVLFVGRPVHGQSDSTIGLFKLTEDGTEATRVNVKLGRSSVNTIEILDGLESGRQSDFVRHVGLGQFRPHPAELEQLPAAGSRPQTSSEFRFLSFSSMEVLRFLRRPSCRLSGKTFATGCECWRRIRASQQ